MTGNPVSADGCAICNGAFPTLNKRSTWPAIVRVPPRAPRRADSAHSGAGFDAEEDLALRLLYALDFPGMRSRLDTVATADTMSFQWVFKPVSDSAAAGSSIKHWLEEGDNYFWLTGTAGTGKSTLMKFLVSSTKTRAALGRKTAYSSVAIMSYFFWGSGKPLQKSIRGLLRACLFQVLEHDMTLAEELAKLLSVYGRPPQDLASIIDSCSEDQLRYALLVLLDSDQTKTVKYCWFIDALGECGSERAVLLSFLDELIARPNVQICVTSTPWPNLKHHFRFSASLMLQSFNTDDMLAYVRPRLAAGARKDVSKEKMDMLASEIINRSNGVFLWVVLVTRDVCECLSRHDPIGMVLDRIDSSPADVPGLITTTLRRQGDTQRRDTAMEYLSIRSASDQPVDLLTFSVACLQHVRSATLDSLISVSLNDAEPAIRENSTTLSSRTAGLLEISYDSNKPQHEGEHTLFSLVQHDVGFLHDSIAHNIGNSLSQKVASLGLLLKSSVLISKWARNVEGAQILSTAANRQALRLATAIAEISPHDDSFEGYLKLL